jgi:membrane-bound lytic murein transglycosylase D
MHRLHALLAALLLLLAASPPSIAAELFPKPPALEPRVEFWKRVFTEIGTDAGFIHDSRNLTLVYEITRLPPGGSRSAELARIRARSEHYAALLRRLADGRREGLSVEERRVLALFGEGVSNRALREASERVRFQRGQANKFREGVVRMGRWEDYIRRVMAERGLPPEFVALPHVESSYNPAAHSHAGASGIWQFTRPTGRMYMQVDHVVDERRDPFLATVAAARLLKANYEKTGTWPLAITAYNHGAGGMQRAIRTLGTRDIVTILDRYDGRAFGFASRNFYPEFLAALEIEKDYEKYFGPLRKDPPENPEIVVLEHYYKAATVASAFGLSSTDLRRENPALLAPIWSGQKYMPRGYALRLPRDGTRPPGKVVLARIAAGERFARQVDDRIYRVQRGDTLSRIAQRFGVRESELVQLNGLRDRHRIRVGQVLKLPVRGAASAIATRDAPSRVPDPVPADGLYRVRPGDTFDGIARRFGVSPADLAEINRVRNRNRIAVGQVLQIPGGAVSAQPITAGQPRGGVYTVARGDTLFAISRRFGVTEQALMERNGLRDPRRLQAGQRLFVPEADGAAASGADLATSGAPGPEPSGADGDGAGAGGAPGDAEAAPGPSS